MKTFKDYLKEAPLPPDWDASVYTPKTSFAKQVRYALERSKRVGAGSSRVVFGIEYEGRPTVLKIAKNKKGLAQNRQEADYGLYRMYPDITAPLIDYDEVNFPPIWIHVEKAVKLTDAKFKAITGFTFKDFSYMLFQSEQERNGRGNWKNHRQVLDSEKLNAIENSELYYDVTSLMGNFGILAGDLGRLANWGIYNGNPVIIDLGFTAEVMKQHYTRK